MNDDENTYDPASIPVMKIGEHTFDEADIKALNLDGEGKRPWSLIMTGEVGVSGQTALSRDAMAALTRIFDRMPNLPVLTVQTKNGAWSVYRDFPNGDHAKVDLALDAIFRNEPEVTGIVFPPRGETPEHVATPQQPFAVPGHEKTSAIFLALEKKEITHDEAVMRISALKETED